MKKIIISILLITVFYSCKNELSKIDKKVLNFIVTFETTSSPCYIKKVYKYDGYNLITVDFIQLKDITDEDGIGQLEVLNKNPKLRTFVINSSTKIIAYNNGNKKEKFEINYNSSFESLKDYTENKNYYFSIEVKKGIVENIEIGISG